MKKLYTNLLRTLICTLFSFGFAQDISITYENPLGIEIGGSEEVYRVSILNNSEYTIDTNSILNINLPIGLSYVDNSVSNNFMDTLISDINNPIFITSNTIAVGDSITLEFSAIAMCDNYVFIDDSLISIRNEISFSYSIGGVSQSQIVLDDIDNYNLSFRDISLEVPIEILNNANQTLDFNNTNEILNQVLNINIPGNSMNFSTFQIDLTPTEELEFTGISELIVDTVNYSVSGVTILNATTTNPTTRLTFDASDIDTSISGFSANMLINVKLNFRAKHCFEGASQHVYYEAIIGDVGGDVCVIDKSIGDFEFSPLTPGLSYSFDSDKGLNLCGNSSKVIYKMSNSIDAEGPAYDVNLLLFEGYGGNVSNIEINGVPVVKDDYVSLVSAESQKKLLENFPNMTDEDGDGDFDDLAPGASITVTCDVSMSLLPENFSLDKCDSGLYEVYFQTEFYSLSSECSSYSGDDQLPSAFRLRDVSENTIIILNNDFDNEEEQTVQLSFNRFGGGGNNQLYEDDMFLEANIEIPCGVDFVLGSGKFNRADNDLELVTEVTTSNIGGKTILNIKVIDPYIFPSSISRYGGKFEFGLILKCDNFSNCTNETTFLKSTIYGAFSECPSQKINLGCVEKELFLHCFPLFPSCPNEYPIVTSSFDAIRTSYGTYTDGTPITIEGVDNGEFQNIKTDGAYACDTVRTEIIGAAVCEIDSSQTFYGYVWYYHPENISFLTMTQAEYRIGLGAPITVSNFMLRTDLSSPIKTVYEIQISGQQVNKYDEIKINSYFAVDKIINNNSNFPNVYKFEEFRGGVSVSPSLPTSPYHYGTDFEAYGLNYAGNSVSNPASCSNDGSYSITFNVTGGSGDDFPNEFRNVVQVVGPVEITIPQEAVGKVVPYTAYYSVTNYGTSALTIESVGDGVYRVYDTGYGSLEEFRIFDKTSSSTVCAIYIDSVLNDCELQEAQTIDVVASHYEEGYASDSCKEIVAHNYSQQVISDGSGFSFGDLRLDVVNPFFQTVDSVTRYKIAIDNISSQQAKYPWIKFTYPDNLITINNSTIEGYDIVGVIHGLNTLLLKLQPINAGNGMEGHIDVTLNDCTFEEQYIDIQIESGISCGPISDDIFNNDGVICPLDTDKKVELEIIKSNLRMDVIPLFDSNVPLQYCDSFQYVVQIFNNEKASITNPRFQVDVPNGFDMSVQYRYPVSEAIDPTNFQFYNTGFSSPIVITNDQLWDLEETNGVLPGYIANQSGYLNNYYQLLVTLTPTCGYDGVSSINFSASGITNCNEDKEITFQSTPVFLELEALNNYSHQLSIDVLQNGDIGNYTAIVHYYPDTDISDSIGDLIVSLPTGIFSTDNLNFTLPSSGGADFAFDFTTDPEYCGDASFLINTIIDMEVGCDMNTICERRIELQDTLIENICIQECVIESVDIEISEGSSCLNYSLYAVTPVVSYGDIVSYDWVLTDINNNVIGNYSGNEIEVDLPNIGTPFTAVLTVIGMNNNGSVCETENTVTLTPNCKPCSIDSEFTISKNKSDACNSIKLIPSITVYNGGITSYLWIIYDEQGNELETIHSNGIIPEPLTYEFSESGIYKVCLDVNSSNILEERCNTRSCKEVIINCTPCKVDAKFSTQKISNCTYQFINHSIVNNWSDVDYLWDFGDGITSTEFEPRHTYTTNGNNYVYLTVTLLNSMNDSCESTFGPIKIETTRCTERGDYINNNIDLFPNPNNGIFTLAFSHYVESCEVDVYDVLGKIIYRRIMKDGNNFLIDISNCANGVYLVKVSNETINITKKIVVE